MEQQHNAVPQNVDHGQIPAGIQAQIQAQQLQLVSQQLRAEADNVAVHARRVEQRSRELMEQAEQAQREVTHAEQRVSEFEAQLNELDQEQQRLELRDRLAQARDKVTLAQARFTNLQTQAQQAQMQARAANTHSEQLRIHANRLLEQAQAQGQADAPGQPQEGVGERINVPHQEIHINVQPQQNQGQNQGENQAPPGPPGPPNIRIDIRPRNPEHGQGQHVFIGDPNGFVVRHQIRIEVNRNGPPVSTHLQPDHSKWLEKFTSELHRLTQDELNELDQNDDICPICYDPLNNISDSSTDKVVVKVPQCGHLFDLECLELWLKEHVTCPYCQRNLRR